MPDPKPYRLDLGDYAVAVLLTLAALATRLYGLGEWDLVGDEFFTVSFASERFPGLINSAYYGLVLASFALFGESEWAARLPAMILGVAAVPALYLTWGRVLGRGAALFAAIFVILSSWHLWYSQFSRFYSGVFLFSLLGTYAFYRALASDSTGRLIAAVILLGLGFLFNATVVMLGGALGVVALLVVWRPDLFGGAFSQRVATLYLGLGFAVGLACLWPLVNMTLDWQQKDQLWGYGPLLIGAQLAKYLQLPVAVGALFGLILLATRDRPLAVTFAVIGAVPAVAMTVASGVTSVRPDYVFYVAPIAYLLAGYLCEAVRRKLRPHALAGLGLATVIGVAMLPEFVSHYTRHRTLDIRDVVAFLESNAQPEDRILSFVPFTHYSSRLRPTEPHPSSLFDHGDWESMMARYLDDGRRLWILLPVTNHHLPPSLDRWLLRNTQLVWRRYAQRFDYTYAGYEIFLKSPATAKGGGYRFATGQASDPGRRE